MGYSNFVIWIINNSFKSSILLLGILIVQRLFIKKLSARNLYALWFLLLAKLAIPVTIKSNLSFYRFIDIARSYLIKSLIKNNTITRVNYNDAILNQITSTTMGKVTILEQSSTSPVAYVWIIVVLGLAIKLISSNISYIHRVKGTPVTNPFILTTYNSCLDRFSIKNDIPLFVTDSIESPAIIGVLHPRILIPTYTNNLSSESLKYIFYHELSHYKRWDVLTLWLVSFLKIVYWFNPFIIYGLNRMIQDSEIACDCLALTYIDDEKEINDYGKTLIDLLSYGITKKRNILTAACTFSNKSYLKRRIRMIKYFKGNSYKISILAVFLTITLACLFMTVNNDNQVLAQTDTESKTTIEYIWPLENDFLITSPYGEKVHPVLKTKKMHNGIDIKAENKTDILAINDGTIISSEELGGYGKTIIIDHGNGVSSLYAHCDELLSTVDDKVTKGQVIAKVGSTGLSTGPHLHFEIREYGKVTDPLANHYLGRYLEEESTN